MERKAFSVSFDWQGEAEECEAGVRLLLPDLGGQLEDGGICVTVIREPGDTLSVCRDGSSARIIYGRRVQFFRALGLLVQHLEDATVYTFCMCPGGHVVAAASEEGRTVTNGMSYADRDGENANAALLVTVNPEEFPFEGVLGGMYWQRSIEEAAFKVGGFRAPAQRVGDFLAGRPSTGPGCVEPTYRPGVTWCALHEVLPEKLTKAMKEAIPQLDRNLKGFADPDAVLTAPETRSSSPVRILRGEDRQSGVRGLYPTGEGAGYAGGIMSAAIDGIQSAEALIASIQ